MNQHVHPALAGLLDSMQTWPSDAREAQRQAYIKLLLRHDWRSDWSDDPDVAQRGRRQLSELRSIQRDLDPTFEIWDAYCPTQCKGGASYA